MKHYTVRRLFALAAPRLRALLLWAALSALFAQGVAAEGLADNEQRVRALDDPVVADVEDILVESGSLFLSYAAPYSDAELRAALDRLDPDTLSEEGRAKYASALAALRPAPRYTSGQLGASASLKVDLDLNWRSDESVPWVLGYQNGLPSWPCRWRRGPGRTSTASPSSPSDATTIRSTCLSPISLYPMSRASR